MMNLESFIKNFDSKSTIVLLEGKREVLENDKEKLFNLGRLLANETNEIIFRSGNSSGSDYFFSEGVCSVNKSRLELVVPYNKHRSKQSFNCKIHSLDDILVSSENEVIINSKKNKKMVKLIDAYISGKRDMYSIKAAYIIRDTIKVIGCKNINPSSFAIFYDDLKNPMQGGTGHTMNICKINNIPLIDQGIWFNWLKS
ncbi:MAG: hypothetical protein RBT49_17395 [Bacteroidales bacterium]|jgi:hypothetical protein|nr:hypothetical protein [Bacteroidales bacterium]